MKLVGATNWRIRLPFLVEGLFESLIGAIAAILFLFAIKVAFIDPLNESIQFIPWITNTDVIAIIPCLLVAGARRRPGRRPRRDASLPRRLSCGP